MVEDGVVKVVVWFGLEVERRSGGGGVSVV